MPEKARKYTGRKCGSRRIYDANRPNSTQRGYNARWQRCTKIHLIQYPLCAECQRHGHNTEAIVVDHIIPHKGNPELFWNPDNWQSMCKACHDRKSGKGQ